jgi:hypothetical protein
MRQSLAIALVFGVGAGCSLIYNPSNLGQPTDSKIFNDAPVDVPPDVEIIMPVNPSELSVTEIYPMTVDEGRGTFGGRPALFVIRGTNFDGGSDAGLVVTLTPTDGGMPLTFTTNVAGDHNFIALQLTAPVDTSCEEGATHNYTLGVTESGATMQTMANALLETCHDQLLTGSGSATVLATAATMPMYSEVKVTNALTITGTSNAIIQSAGGIEIDGTITANAAGQTGVAGGSNGGGDLGTGAGAGAGAGGVAGGGAGFSMHGTPTTGSLTAGVGGPIIGDLAISSYATNYASGGGGGTLTSGGGGGGTIELTARGDVTIGTVQVHGGPASGGSGGAGAGGVIVVRALGGTAHGTISLDAAPGGTGTAASPGRTRIDGTTANSVASQFYGPGFGTPSLISTQQDVTLMLTGQPLTMFNGYVQTRKNDITNFSFMTGPNPTTYGTAMQSVTLTSGYNTVCVLASGTLSASTADVAQDCIEMAFLP